MARVLAADDDLEALELIKMGLEMAGHEVTAVSDGRQALDRGLAGEFDVYVLDVTMPFVDGYHVAEALSEKFPGRQIILLTSRDFDRDRVAIEASGADLHIAKPFDINELLRAIRMATEKGGGA
jgi:two-component system, OmpR family, copper resistance phosphate regulon response regulator CusR